MGLVGELDALLDVALEALDGGLEENLLLLGNIAENINSLLSSVDL